MLPYVLLLVNEGRLSCFGFGVHIPILDEVLSVSYARNYPCMNPRFPKLFIKDTWNSPRQAHVLSGSVEKDVLFASGVVKKNLYCLLCVGHSS